MKTAFKDLFELMHQSDPEASFALELWDGEHVVYGTAPAVTLRIKDERCAKTIMGGGFLGFGEAYMCGDVEVAGDLGELLRLGLSVDFDGRGLPWTRRIRIFLLSLLHRDTIRRTPKNIAYHYDRGNDFYALFLDRTMTYSCAYFRQPEDTLDAAQEAKCDHIARKLDLQDGDSLLDIGCGWGALLIRAAQEYGVRGLGVTLSREQHDYAQTRIKELGLEGRVRVDYRDYRKVDGRFDKLVSVGMFEHVGKRFIPVFIGQVARLLKNGGVGLLHTIGKDRPTPTDPWTTRYIFPGGYLPTLGEIASEMGRRGLSVLDVENLRLHYARTLEHWSANYERHIDQVRALFDQAFVRRWRLFLEASRAGFLYGDIRLFQVLFSNGRNNDLPMTRAHWYCD